MWPSKKILLIISGSVGAFKGAALASQLTKEGHAVRTILTDSALLFIGSAQIEGLTREKVYTSAFERGEAHSHLTLSQWADLTIVYPATANLLAKWSMGLGDDLASLVHLAHEGSIWIAPAMNPRMWKHPAISEAVQKLEARGHRIIRPDSGRMACGEVGEGRLPEPDAMTLEIQTRLKTRSAAGPHVLVTAGGTREPIDAVRSITNTSTGETGVRIAEALAASGFQVTLLQSAQSRASSTNVHSVRFDTFEDFEKLFRAELATRRYIGLVHAAAVSDYHVKGPKQGKISSDAPVQLQLVPRPKLVSLAREYSGQTLEKIVSFKLTVGDDAFDPSKYATSDVIIQNRLSEVQGETHTTRIYRKDSRGSWTKATELGTKAELCGWIRGYLGEKEGSP